MSSATPVFTPGTAATEIGPSAADPTAVGGRPGHRVVIRGAVKRFGATTALHGIDLEIEPGRFLVLLGPSGSGKSTLVRALAGVERLDGGQIAIAGRVVGDARIHLPPERRELAMVFQDYSLWPHLSVIDNVLFALHRRHLTAPRARTIARDTLDRVGLGALAGRYPHELSGGEQQRVALARAVVARPGLLLFDEPLSNLDADLRERLRVEIATLTRESGATAVYITHDQSEAFALADEIGVLDHGILVQRGRPEDVYHHPATPFVARFTGLAGEVTGRVLDRRDAAVTVEVGAGVLTAQWQGRPAPSTGTQVQVLIRPAATAIHTGAPTTPNLLAGTVVDVAYRGRGYDHVLRTAAGPLSGVFHPHSHPRGTALTVRLDPAGCLAFPAP